MRKLKANGASQQEVTEAVNKLKEIKISVEAGKFFL